ncbi:MAG: hypothetical protein B6D65_02020 [candidate division Zixibacteria bacterium 4484_93]|nr:MAG: hypothetical protein B6D65_02020 [candidate division Zixibacteria bacterium 4484_93]
MEYPQLRCGNLLEENQRREQMRKRELDHFRRILLMRKKALEKEIEELENSVTNPNDSGVRGDNLYSTHPADIGMDNLELENSYLFASKVTEMLVKIEEALERIGDGSYGKCSICGKRISKERLNTVPWAEVCIDCKRKEEKNLL